MIRENSGWWLNVSDVLIKNIKIDYLIEVYIKIKCFVVMINELML